MLSAYSGASSSEGNSPVQPVKFRHTIHVDTLKMNCLYCHFAANKSFDPGLPAMKAVGLPELLRHLGGELALADAMAAAQRATRQYAKRQMTWFRHQTAPDLILSEPFSEELLRCTRQFVDECVLTG